MTKRRSGIKPVAKQGDKLTAKEALFVAYYPVCLNGTKAAEMAGYEGNRNVLAVTASENLRKPKIRRAIDARLKKMAMSADEILARLTDHARGTMDDFVDAKTGLLNLRDAAEAGKLHLLKKLRVKTQTVTGEGTAPVEIKSIEFELYDAQAALLNLHRMLRLDKGLPTEIVGMLPDLIVAMQKAGVKPSDVFNEIMRTLSEAEHAHGK